MFQIMKKYFDYKYILFILAVLQICHIIFISEGPRQPPSMTLFFSFFVGLFSLFILTLIGIGLLFYNKENRLHLLISLILSICYFILLFIFPNSIFALYNLIIIILRCP
jgi:hypothetical protein